jgi:hypothetical protein
LLIVWALMTDVVGSMGTPSGAEKLSHLLA